MGKLIYNKPNYCSLKRGCIESYEWRTLQKILNLAIPSSSQLKGMKQPQNSNLNLLVTKGRGDLEIQY